MSANYAPQSTDPKNPAEKYYSGITSMVLAAASLFILTPLLSTAGVVFGIVGIVHGNKLDNRKLRGEGWFGTVFAGVIMLGWLFVFSGGGA